MVNFLNGCVIAVRRAGWKSRVPGYRGVASTLWWPLRQHADKDLRASELTDALRTRWLSQPVERIGPHACDDLDLIQSYIATCDKLQLGSLCAHVCATRDAPSSAPAWLSALRAACDRVGLDVTYPSGGYSFINDDFSPEGGDVYQFLERHLNPHGLFDTSEEAEEFMRLHQRANDSGANLETLDDAIAVELWEDSDLSRLRGILPP